jgi:hypothetical protein
MNMNYGTPRAIAVLPTVSCLTDPSYLLSTLFSVSQVSFHCVGDHECLYPQVTARKSLRAEWCRRYPSSAPNFFVNVIFTCSSRATKFQLCLFFGELVTCRILATGRVRMLTFQLVYF